LESGHWQGDNLLVSFSDAFLAIHLPPVRHLPGQRHPPDDLGVTFGDRLAAAVGAQAVGRGAVAGGLGEGGLDFGQREVEGGGKDLRE
jgi:hypothetical protein